MSTTPVHTRIKSHGMLAPFGEPGFRYQWPADLATSLAFDMETIILAWYVFVETKSVTMLTIFASMRSRLKRSSTILRVIEPVSNRMKGCRWSSVSETCRFMASGWLG